VAFDSGRSRTGVHRQVYSDFAGLVGKRVESYVLGSTPVKVILCTTVDLQRFQRSPSKINDPELA